MRHLNVIVVDRLPMRFENDRGRVALRGDRMRQIARLIENIVHHVLNVAFDGWKMFFQERLNFRRLFVVVLLLNERIDGRTNLSRYFDDVARRRISQ